MYATIQNCTIRKENKPIMHRKGRNLPVDPAHYSVTVASRDTSSNLHLTVSCLILLETRTATAFQGK